jgi:hypothetical protein
VVHLLSASTGNANILFVRVSPPPFVQKENEYKYKMLKDHILAGVNSCLRNWHCSNVGVADSNVGVADGKELKLRTWDDRI